VDLPRFAFSHRSGTDGPAQHHHRKQAGPRRVANQGAAPPASIVALLLDGDWDGAARATEEAMRAGPEFVYPAVLVDPSGWRGIADFLERQPDGFSTRSATRSLARAAKQYFLLRLAF
jgi:hypothetical protein